MEILIIISIAIVIFLAWVTYSLNCRIYGREPFWSTKEFPDDYEYEIKHSTLHKNKIHNFGVNCPICGKDEFKIQSWENPKSDLYEDDYKFVCNGCFNTIHKDTLPHIISKGMIYGMINRFKDKTKNWNPKINTY